jgi:hypothetical protein
MLDVSVTLTFLALNQFSFNGLLSVIISIINAANANIEYSA